jgi:hypothetical protein
VSAASSVTSRSSSPRSALSLLDLFDLAQQRGVAMTITDFFYELTR